MILPADDYLKWVYVDYSWLVFFAQFFSINLIR